MAFAGVTVMLDSVAAMVVASEVADLPPKLPVIYEEPAATPVRRPALLTLTAAGVAETNEVFAVTSTELPSEYAARTASWRVAPICRVDVAGVIDSDIRAAGWTFRVAVPLRPPEVALMTEVPGAIAFAMPPEAAMVATFGDAEAKVDTAVMSRVVLLSKVPIATYCSELPTLSELTAGATAIDISLAGNTFRVAEPDFPPKAAAMRVVPVFTPTATPVFAWILATAGVAEDQAAMVVTSRAEPSE